MEHDVASYDRPYSGGTHSFEDEPTEVGMRVPARRKPPVAKIPITAKLPRRPSVEYASPLPLPERMPAPPRVAVPPPMPRAVAATPAPVQRRWSARTLAMFGAGMGTASGMLVAVAVLLGLAITAPTGGSASRTVTPEGVGWVDMVTAVGTTLVTGKPAVSIAPAAKPAASPVVVHAAPAQEAPVLTAVVETAVASAPPVIAAARAPARARSRAKGAPVSAPVEIDPWKEPLLPVEPIVGGGEGMAASDIPASRSENVSAPARGPDVDLLAGDDGLGEATQYTPVKATLAGFGEAPASPDQEAISELQTIETRVVRIAVEGALAPIEVDGRKVGTAPVALDLEPGSHAVKLLAADGKATTFELEATADLDQWCFEVRGRSFGQVRCE